MGTLFKTSVYVVCCFSLISLSACSDDDDENDGLVPGLVSSTVPTEGWSGSTTNGICTYRPGNIDPEDEDFSCYYAFSFENGKCTDGVFNVVCESENVAKQLSQMLNDGSWVDEGDEEDYSMSQLKNDRNPVLMQALRCFKTIKTAVKSTRAVDVMGITCTQEGRIVYFRVEAVKGLDGEDVKYVMKAWNTGLEMSTLPEKTIFGTWDEAAGKYTSNSIYAIPGTKVEIATAFSSLNILTKYVITYTLPNVTWAAVIEESLEEQLEGYEELTGIEFAISRTDNIVTVNMRNVEIANTTKEYLIKMIIAMDILNARPIGSALFL